MPTDNVRAQQRLAFKCLNCASIRAYGFVQTLTPESNLTPIIRCDWCEKNTKHNYIGRQFFDVELVRYEDIDCAFAHDSKIMSAVFTPRYSGVSQQ